MRRVSLPGIGAKLVASRNGGGLGVEAGGTAVALMGLLHTVPGRALLEKGAPAGSVRVGALSVAMDSSGTVARERGVTVDVGSVPPEDEGAPEPVG